jgi:FkbM family methyltransferase
MDKKIGKIINRMLSFFGIAIHTIPFKSDVKKTENLIEKDIIEKKIEKIEDSFFNSDLWLKNKNFKSVIDIGANEGQFAEKFSKLFPEAIFYCFEPLNEPYEKLKEKFSNNGKFNFFNFALGNVNGKIKIQRNEYSPSSSILPMRAEHKNAFDFARKEFAEDVNIRILGNVFKNVEIERPYLLKIDVQGYELPVIEGGTGIVKNAEIIIIETSFVELYEGAPLFNDIYKKLNNLGFEYIGSFEQLLHPSDGKILQQDSIFQKIKNK